MSSREKAAERRLTREIPPLKTPIAANAVFLVCILFFGGLYLSSKYWSQSKPLQDSLKSFASVLFLLCCVFNVCFSEARDKEKRGVSYRRLLLWGRRSPARATLCSISILPSARRFSLWDTSCFSRRSVLWRAFLSEASRHFSPWRRCPSVCSVSIAVSFLRAWSSSYTPMPS